jgi:voltage-gated hydrogen channel 1
MAEEQQPLLENDLGQGTSYTTFLFARDGKVRVNLRRGLASRSSHYSILALVTLDVGCIFADLIIKTFQCEKEDLSPAWNITVDVLGIISVIISCLFMVELLISIWAFGLRYLSRLA